MSSISQQAAAVIRADRPIAVSDDTGTGVFGLDGWQFYGAIIVLALVVGALSLLFAATASFDPWAWLVWGREILHGSLHTAGGPSWKPLPVIFTTIFAIFGKAAPDLWLIIARAGFVVTILMSGKLAARFTLWLAPGFGTAQAQAQPLALRLAAAGPAVLAALIAMFAIALSGGWLSNSTLGYSEGLAVAFMLIGCERHVDGHHRQAFICGLVVALDRPETWVVWGPYGLWLMWKDPGARALVISLAVLTVLLWFVPQQLGGGSLDSGLVRATHVRGNSNALKSFPFWSELQSAWGIMVFRVKIAGALMTVGGLGLLTYNWRTRDRPTARLRLSVLQRRAVTIAVVSGLAGLAWWVLIAIETQAGFSGNNRYLTLGEAALTLSGAMAYGACAILLAQLPALWVPEDRARLKLSQRLILGTAVLSAFFVAFPNWVGSNFINLGSFRKSMIYQAGLRQDMTNLIKDNGGASGLESCGAGEIMVEGFQVPMAAWLLNDRMANIRFKSVATELTSRPWPNIVLQDRDIGGAGLLPNPQQMNQWTKVGAHYQVSTTSEISFYKDCSSQPHDSKARISS